jgi:hypothetical protein
VSAKGSNTKRRKKKRKDTNYYVYMIGSKGVIIIHRNMPAEKEEEYT